MKWGQKDVGLWINLMIPQCAKFNRQLNSTVLLIFVKLSLLSLMNLNVNSLIIADTAMNAHSVGVDIQCRDVSKRPHSPLNYRLLPRSHFQKALTLVSMAKMRPWLETYPNKEKADLIFSGLTDGFFCSWVFRTRLHLC